ncbi:MAG TPA: DoxX family protein [Actinophytocola sp.]|jgi:putative oxidoreductase|uniref:DoxX family protein n=1 Tax=Actinophytocola sp. TaxID=1872138 RepID=UPI002F9351F0
MAELTVTTTRPSTPAPPGEHTATIPTSPARLSGAVLSAARAVVGFLYACHGADSLFGVFGREHTAAFGAWPSWYAGVIALFGGALVAIGLATRPAALLCSGAMAFAYFTVHQPGGLLPIQNHGEPAAMFCWTFLLIATLGPGSFALDTLRRRRA